VSYNPVLYVTRMAARFRPGFYRHHLPRSLKFVAMEASSQATCRATTKQGNPCRKPAGEGGLCVFHSGRLDLAELGRRGGQARGRKREQDEEETQGERLTRGAWKALEELLASDAPATAKVRAASELLDHPFSA
jgi:uncharacterized protein DUF5763